MSNNQGEARNTMDRSTRTAMNNLIIKTSTKFDFIKLAMDSLPADKKYDVDALLEKTRSQVEQITKNKVGESAAKTIANALTVRHIVEYIIHIKQQEEDNAQQQEEAQQDPPQESRDTARLNRQAIIDAALKEAKWRLEPVLKRARLYDPKVTMADVKK